KFHLAAGHCTQHRPHVAWDRNICYSDGEGIFFNHEQPKEVIHSALASVVEVLEDGEVGNLNPFWDEQEGYFNLVGPEATRGVAECYFQLDETPCKLEAFKSANRKRPVKFLKDKSDGWGLNSSLYIKEQLEQAKGVRKRKQKGKAPQCHSPAAFYLPLDKPVVPPLSGQEWEVERVLELVEPFMPKLPELETYLKKKHQLYVFSVPRSVGGRGAFAVEIIPKKRDDPKVFYFEVDRRHDSYLKERGGVLSDYRLNDENVAVIGCGAVGGYIATTLASCGFRNIELVDCDTFKAENLYRHVLPYKYLGKSKVSGLKALLENSLPSMNIKDSELDAESWCTKNNLDKNQIIFLATGNPVLERYINQTFCAERRGNHVLISTWLEPVGLGGHVVLKASNSKGCLNCLYVEENDLRYYPIPSFIEPEQKVSRNLTGCGGAFTPFSSLDAQQTALLAVRITEKYYSETAGSIYDFWMGDKSAAEENGIRTSEVFETSFCDKELWWQQKLSHGCPVCMGC
ncbi:MAG: ThiF family adenylyltransferase, partial [Anaerolineales bacterium]